MKDGDAADQAVGPGRVLHCIPTMAGGGSERQLTYLAGALGRIGWEVHVAVTRRGANWSRLEASRAVIHEIKTGSSYDHRVLTGLRSLMAELKPDVVQVWLLQMEVLGGVAALLSHTPWVFSERASEQAYPRTLKNRLRDRMAGFSDAIVSNSVAGDQYWTGRVSSRVRRLVVPNGIPLDEIAAEPPATDEEIGIEATEPLVLFAGRMEPGKNLDVLIRALTLVLRRTDARVLCCGEGPLRGLIDNWRASEALEARVKVAGYQPRLWGVMKRARMLISPSLFEGHPNIVLEAMACGLPLVLSGIPAHRALVDEQAARLFDPSSPEAFASAIEDVLRDPAGAKARADVARARVAELDVPTMARGYDRLYRALLT